MNIPQITGYQICTSPSCAYNKEASPTKPPMCPDEIEKTKAKCDLECQDKFVKSESQKSEGQKDKYAALGYMYSAGGGTN